MIAVSIEGGLSPVFQRDLDSFEGGAVRLIGELRKDILHEGVAIQPDQRPLYALVMTHSSLRHLSLKSWCVCNSNH
jgi:hypothetical protein